MSKSMKITGRLGLVVLLIAALQIIALAQGRGRGGGPPAGIRCGGPPSGIGVDRGISASSTRSAGRADTGRSTASDRSNGRSDASLDRARLQRENAQQANDELRNNPEMAAHLHTT